MVKKLIVTILCGLGIIGITGMFFLFLYFAVPSKMAASSIDLPSTVKDAEKSTSSTEDTSSTNSNVYVADVYQSLTLREKPDSSSNELTSLPPMTHLEVIEEVSGTDYDYVEVLTGNYKGYKGYVNGNYITPLGESTVRVGNDEE